MLHISEDLRITASLGIFLCSPNDMKEFDFPREDVEPSLISKTEDILFHKGAISLYRLISFIS